MTLEVQLLWHQLKRGSKRMLQKKRCVIFWVDCFKLIITFQILKPIFFRLLPEDSKCFPVIWKKRCTIASPMRWVKGFDSRQHLSTFNLIMWQPCLQMTQRDTFSQFLGGSAQQHYWKNASGTSGLFAKLDVSTWIIGVNFWQDYVAVLEKYFPGRMEMMLFLRYICRQLLIYT